MTGGTDHDDPRVAAVIPRSDDPDDDLVVYSEHADQSTVRRILEMTGGTDHEIETEGYYAARLLRQERIDDTIYAVQAWAKGLSWTSLLAAVGGLCTGLATRNWLAVAASCTGIVGVFLPQLNSRIVNQVIVTALMSTGRIPQPDAELPIKPTK